MLSKPISLNKLDSYYACLHGLTRDELRYILDPKEVHGEDFPGETVRVVKEKEIKQYQLSKCKNSLLKFWKSLEFPECWTFALLTAFFNDFRGNHILY